MTEVEASLILAELRGQSIVLPDLNVVFNGWPRHVNVHLDRLRRDVDRWLDSAMGHNPRLEALKAADFAHFGATWWPHASYDRLKVVTFLAVWLFAWDDEIDMDDGCLWHDSDLSQPYRDETRLHVMECLGLTDDLNRFPVRSVNPTILAFEGIGNAIRSVYTYEQRRRFMKHMEDFLEMSRREQALRLRGTLPTVEEFWSYRLGSSAVHITLAMNEFACNNNSLPASVMAQEHMTLLWEYTNIIVSVTNDILSLKKEVTRGSIGSMIPLEYAQSRNAQSAVDKTTLLLANAIDAFKQTAEKLLHRSPEITSCEQTRALGDFVKGCQFYCTGNLAWSLATRRYGIYEHDLAKGVCITL